MQRNSTTRQLVESALLTAITVILILIGYYIPIFYFIGLFIYPLPLALIYIRSGRKYSIMSLVVSAVIIGITINPVSAVSITGLSGLLGIALGYSIKSKKSLSITIGIMAAVTFISTVTLIKLSTIIIGQDVLTQTINELTRSMDLVRDFYINMGMPKDQVEMALKAFPTPEVIKILIPAMMVMHGIITAFITYLMAQKIFGKFGYNLDKMKPLSEWYIPVWLMMGLLAFIVFGFILRLLKIPNVDSYFINSTMIFSFIFSINGLAAVSFILKRRKVAKGLRTIIILFLMFSQLSNLLYYAGIIDYVLDYRKLDPKRKSFKLQ